MTNRNVLRGIFGGFLLLIAIAATVFAVGLREGQHNLNQIEQRLNARGTASANILLREVEHWRHDVTFLASVPPTSGLVRAAIGGGHDAAENTPMALWERRLKAIFSAYALANPDIFQVRLIGMANRGRELIRVDRVAGKIAVLADDSLQEKGDRDYVRIAAGLPAGQVYISDINLNREHGRIQTPHVATIRAAMPIYEPGGKVFGVLVINYDVAGVMAQLSSNMPADFRVYLSNGQGDFLLHPDPARLYGFDLGRRWRWQDEFQRVSTGDDFSTALHRYTSSGGLMYATEKKIALDPLRRERDLVLALAIPDTPVLEGMRAIRLQVLMAMLAGATVMGGSGFLYLRQRRRVSEYQARMSAIVENSHDAIIGKTLDGTVTSWNRGAERMFGYGVDEALGRALVDLIVPAGAEAEEADILRRIERGEGVDDFETRRRRKDGSVFDVSVTSSPIRAEGGQIVGAAKTVRDVSAQKEINRQIHELNATLEAQVRLRTAQIESVTILQRAILAHASYAIIATDTQGIIRLFNPAAERMLGYAAAELVGHYTPAILHDGAEVAARAVLLSQELGREIAVGFDVFVAKARLDMGDESAWTYLRKDGSRFPVLLSVSALRGEDGGINGYLGIASDISVRAQDQRTLVAARDQLLNAAEVAELGIWSWSLAEDVIEWNERMYVFYDVPLSRRGEGLRYEDWRSRVHPEDVGGAEAKLRAAIDGSGKYDPVFRILRADGQLRYIQAAASVERDAQGKAVRVLGINRDITSQYEAEEVLRVAKLEADVANRAKSEFLANMSHEIRSPMNAVLGMLTLLKQTELAPKQFDYADKAEVAGRTLLGILNDILDFSRVEAGKLALDLHPFSMDQMLRETGVILSANVGERDIDIRYELAADLPEWVTGDSMRLQQVLINLAGNAVKFTQQGEVVIKVGLLATDGASGPEADPLALRLGFSIRDTGIGISAEQCQRIFDGFSQAEASTARRYGGSGLGLAICQRLVSLMDGLLTVESTVGQGSTFSFSISCRRAAAAAAPQRDLSTLRGLSCLVIDDHQSARESMIAMLGKFGWNVDAVDSGEQALAALQGQDGNNYDVIFVDWHMHGIDGWETCLRIRKVLPADRPTPIIMVTAHGHNVQMMQQDGAQGVLDGVVIKPVTGSMLFDAVADAGAALHLFGITAHGVKVGQRRLIGLRLLVVEDNPTNQQVAFELLSNDGASVEVAGDGRAAIEAVRHASPAFDCVLMDIQMPEMDGYTAARAIRGELAMRDLPIIAMTANALDSDRKDALDAGMNDHVGKPFDLTHLVATILRHTGRPPAAIDAVDKVDKVDKVEPSSAVHLQRPGINGERALARFGGNALFYRRALRHFVAEIAEVIAQLPAVLPEERQRPAAAALHSLKGVAGTVGADALADVADRMERSLHGEFSAASWALAHAQLVVAAEQAGQDGRDLAQQLEGDTPSGSGDGVDMAGLPAALVTLRQLLDNSSLDALSLFEQLQRDFGERMRAEFAPLNSAIEQFEFAIAVQQCDTILKQLSSEPS
ncbi:PAS domain S-box protein [Oxalobacteraceae bacterium]|nr:PAS domain S-box protein [Oxalobacteraceae bacterium]